MQARTEITAWKEDYNRNRPHSSLGNFTPSEFALKIFLEKQAAYVTAAELEQPLQSLLDLAR